MPRFSLLTLVNLRCFENLRYEAEPGINLICGPNGSGKTTVLEALAICSLGRSFLTNRTTDLVKGGSAGLVVKAVLSKSEAEGRFGSSAVTVKRSATQTEIALDGVPVVSASTLARSVPLLVFNSRAPDLLVESSANRRALIDRTLFHVKQDYIDYWKQYRHALQQRNELVRKRSRGQSAFWNHQLGMAALEIHQARTEIISVINTAVAAELGNEFAFDYHPGFSPDISYEEQLDSAWDRDLVNGYTFTGPHRADFTLKSSGRPIGKRLSRGQSKNAVCVVLAALSAYIRGVTGFPPVMLVDDLAAELDDEKRGNTVRLLTSTGGQCFFTAIRPADLPEISNTVSHVFHVEHA